MYAVGQNGLAIGRCKQVIKVRYSSVDSRGGKWRSFKTLKRARIFAQHWIGKYPEIGSTYAVSGDGIGKIEVQGAKLADLFGDEKPATPSSPADEPDQEIDY